MLEHKQQLTALLLHALQTTAYMTDTGDSTLTSYRNNLISHSRRVIHYRMKVDPVLPTIQVSNRGVNFMSFKFEPKLQLLYNAAF